MVISDLEMVRMCFVSCEFSIALCDIWQALC